MINGPNADERFVNYYAEQSASDQTHQRIESVRRMILGLRTELGLPTDGLSVVDVGCGAGAQALAWAGTGHKAQGIDISSPLIELARKRAYEVGSTAEFRVGSAGRLPLPDQSSDVVLVSELLEHLPNWEECVDESVRILRPGGVVYFSTTNRLCPVQQEFKLPLYGWYPEAVKRHCERLAVTTHPHWVQYASFPAVNWFTFYQFRDYLAAKGIEARDRFDVMLSSGSAIRSAVIGAIKYSAALRFFGHVLTPYTVVVGIKRPANPGRSAGT